MALGNKEVMANNIKHYMKIHNVTASQICADLGFPAATFSDWTHAKTYPRIDKIEKMANYFNISKSDLVEHFVDVDYIVDTPCGKLEMSINKNNTPIYDRMEVMALYNSLTKEQQEMIINVMKNMK